MKLFIAASLLLTCFAARAQQEMNLYDGAIPNSKGCPVKEEWTNNTTARGTVKKVTVPTLKVFMPAKVTSGMPAVIICPGGGYANLSIFDGGYETAEELNKAGIVAFVLKYRLSDSLCNSNNSLVALQDAQQAIYIIRKNAAKWNVDPSKVGYVGFSAGGHLAAMASTHYQDAQIKTGNISLRPDFTILAYPVISFTDALTSRISKTRVNLLGDKVSQQQIKWFSAEQNVTAQTPPAFLIQASDDSTALVENSLAYYKALHQYKTSATLKLYQKGGHGFANYNKAEDDHWLPSAIKWLKLNHFLD